jgi:hypothetical protein
MRAHHGEPAAAHLGHGRLVRSRGVGICDASDGWAGDLWESGVWAGYVGCREWTDLHDYEGMYVYVNEVEG